MMDEEGNQFVAYFLPNEETLRKRKRDFEEGMDYMPEDLWVKKKKYGSFSVACENHFVNLISLFKVV